MQSMLLPGLAILAQLTFATQIAHNSNDELPRHREIVNGYPKFLVGIIEALQATVAEAGAVIV